MSYAPQCDLFEESSWYLDKLAQTGLHRQSARLSVARDSVHAKKSQVNKFFFCDKALR